MIYHILKDGTVLEDITGHVVQVEDAEPVYRLMRAINERATAKEREERNNGS